MSADAALTVDQLRAGFRAELAARRATSGTTFYLELNEGQAADIASGYVPTDIRAMVLWMMDWFEEDRRRAARPVQKPARRKKER